MISIEGYLFLHNITLNIILKRVEFWAGCRSYAFQQNLIQDQQQSYGDELSYHETCRRHAYLVTNN